MYSRCYATGELTTVSCNPFIEQQIDKHIPVATNTHATIEEPISKKGIDKHTTTGVLLETVFSVRSVQNVIKKSSFEKS
jgi:hypothetical protein